MSTNRKATPESEARGPRDYKDEYKKYHASKEQKERRANRNKARSDEGLKKGDTREASHVKAPRKGSLAGVAVKKQSGKANSKNQPKRGKSRKA